ncbi:MAG: 16S rRNA (cytosine(1402)-N(4))-methyltransferase RsmH, partial [Bacteroidota bacterium]
HQIEDERFLFIKSNFKFIEKELQERDLLPVQGILADLGVSSHQLDTPERGFSFRFSAPLDMRMNPDQGRSAREILQEASEEELRFIFHRFGEVPNAKRLAREIVERRTFSPLIETRQFEEAIKACIPQKRRAKYLAQVYQALRIEVNQELQALQILLESSLRILKPGGRLVIIAYHSLEDRLVKHFFRSGNFADKIEKDFYGAPITPWKLITRKALQADEVEIQKNPRSRSARLRVAQKK